MSSEGKKDFERLTRQPQMMAKFVSSVIQTLSGTFW